MHQNVSIALALFLSCLDYPAERNRIVYTAMNFPSVRYLLEGERKKGAEDSYRAEPEDKIGVDLETLLAAIDEQHASGSDLPRPFSERLHSERSGHRRALPRGRSST